MVISQSSRAELHSAAIYVTVRNLMDTSVEIIWFFVCKYPRHISLMWQITAAWMTHDQNTVWAVMEL